MANRISQMYAALSRCNQAIVRCSTREELFVEICKAAVESGGMKGAWIGLVEAQTGKVNPVIPEVVNQVSFYIIGNDLTITMAAEAGQLELNAFEPVIAYSAFRSISHLIAACDTLRMNCVQGITANHDVLRETVRNSIGIVTALNPYIGYANATEVAAEAHASGRGVAEIVLERGLMSASQLAEVLRPEVLTRPQPIPTLPANATTAHAA